MDSWISEIQELGATMVGPNAPAYEWALMIGLGLLASALVWQFAAAASGAAMATFTRTVVLVLVTVLVLLSAIIALRLYVIPQLHATPTVKYLPHVVALMLVLSVILPLASWLHKLHYFESALPFLLGLLTAVAVSFLLRYAFTAFKSGDAGFMKTRNRRDSINRVIESNR